MSAARASAVVFAYHNVGVRCLSVLLAHGVDVRLVVSHPDNPQEHIWFDSVAELATRHDLTLLCPDSPTDPALRTALVQAQPDFLFSFYYRHMLPVDLLELAPRGAYNMHGSLLPKYRGRVPVNWAVLHGERETGATLHRMAAKPDAGSILGQQAVPILPDDTAGEVFQKVTVAAELVLDRVLPALLAGTAEEQPQNLSAGSYFGGRRPEDGRIDWNQSAAQIHNLVRAVAPPYPGAYCDCAGQTLRVLRTLHTTNSPRSAQPGLYAVDGTLYLDCCDGVLKLLAATLDGARLTAADWQARYGEAKLVLV